jgi:hypothetical protein
MIFRLAASFGTILLVAVSSGSSARISQNGAGQGEAVGRHVITNRDVDIGADRTKETEIRAFLWDHWINQKSGRLTETRYSKEGLETKTTFVFKPDEPGASIISITVDRPALKNTTADHVEYRVIAVRRTKPAASGGPNADFIPDGDQIPPGSYRLVFYDKNGKKIEGL